MALTDEQHIWACAVAIERIHGAAAPLVVAERIGALALAGDEAGVAMWKAIAARLDALTRATSRDQKVGSAGSQ